VLEARRKALRETLLANLRLRPFDGIGDTPKACPARVQVKHEICGARIPVARLADRAGVEEPPVGRVEIELGSVDGEVARDEGPQKRELEGEMAVTDERERLGRGDERLGRHVLRHHVLPHGVPRAAVEERHAGAHGVRPERLEEGARLVVELAGRPAGAHRRVGGEELEVEPAEHAEVVVSDQADVGALGDDARALVRSRPVPYEVPEAPELVGALAVDRLEDGLEGVEVRVDVRDDAGAHGRATLAKAAGGIAFACLWVAAAWLLLRTETPDGLALPELDPGAYFPADHLDRADRYRGVTRGLWAAGVVVQLAVLALIVARARPLAAWLSPKAGGRVRTGVVLGLVALGATWLAGLPLGVFRHWWGRRYGLTEQGYLPWLGDRAISLAVTALLLTIGVAGAVWLAGRLGRRWWLAAAPALVVLGVGYIVVQPVVIQPLFNRFEPLADAELARGVERLGDEIGVRVDRVEVADASRRTTTANAYVAGLGPTRRVVFYDTALDGRFTDDELLSLAAHELAHVERSHLWKGLAWFALLAVPGLALVAWGTERRGGLRDPALVPLGLLLALAVILVTQPVANAVSRAYEAEADWIALEATGDPESAIGLTVRFSLTGLGDPDPPTWSRLLLGTHPAGIERIAMAEAYSSGEWQTASRFTPSGSSTNAP